VITLTTVDDVRAWCRAERRAGRRVGFVPTMGYFHDGHRSLMRAARGSNDAVVVSIFVNPTQFAPTEDLSRYPRDPHGDATAATEEGVDVLFTPTVAEMYPGGACTTVHVEGLSAGLCGATRPGHFDGVTTVVAKLFSIVGPCRAYFGRKDAQQLAVIRRMTADLNLPVDVIGCPLVREADGLAMSSRNAYLSPAERETARLLSWSLRGAADTALAGARDAAQLRAVVVDILAGAASIRLDYAEVVDAATLTPVDTLGSDSLVAIAAFVGTTRLIDNVSIHVDGEAVTVDTGVVTRTSAGVPVTPAPAEVAVP
jgi:pantoate--beta-alanine ligase